MLDDEWVRAVQAFACLGLLHCRELRDAQDGPRRARALLTQLAYGVEDWITEAALFGLATAAWVDPACRPEVARTVKDRYVAAVRASEQHVVTILPGLSSLVLIVPGIDESAKSYAKAALVASDDETEDSAADG